MGGSPVSRLREGGSCPDRRGGRVRGDAGRDVSGLALASHRWWKQSRTRPRARGYRRRGIRCHRGLGPSRGRCSFRQSVAGSGSGENQVAVHGAHDTPAESFNVVEGAWVSRLAKTRVWHPRCSHHHSQLGIALELSNGGRTRPASAGCMSLRLFS